MKAIYENEEVRVYENKSKKSTTAVLQDVQFDAIFKILKVLNSHNHDLQGICEVPNLESALIPTKIVATTVCHAGDEFDSDEGRKVAIKKVMKKHNLSFRKALKRWQIAMLKDIIAVSPDTFEEALHTVRPCKCKCQDNK